MNPPRLFDPDLTRLRLARAWQGIPPLFLLERVVEDMLERLAAVKRSFQRVVDLGTPAPLLVESLARERPDCLVTHLAPVRGALGQMGGIIADAQMLPLAAGSVDLIVSALALHSIDDLPGALAQIRRALRPDGLFMACLPGGQTLHELRHAMAAAEAEITGGASPRVAPFADLRDLGGLLQRAGLALPVTDVDSLIVRYASMFDLMRDLRAMGATSNLVQRSRIPLRRGVLVRAAQIYAEQFADADGRVRATFELVWLSGWAPHESQQKPLKPGSAKMRLADALGTTEIKASEIEP